jgi:hypothetical protein
VVPEAEPRSPWDEPLFGEYLRLLKARGMKLPKLRKKARTRKREG